MPYSLSEILTFNTIDLNNFEIRGARTGIFNAQSTAPYTQMEILSHQQQFYLHQQFIVTVFYLEFSLIHPMIVIIRIFLLLVIQ